MVGCPGWCREAPIARAALPAMVGINWAATIGVFKILGTNGFRIAFIGGESSSRHRTILFPSTKSARALPSSSTQCCSTNGDLSAKAGTRSKKSCSSSAKTLSVEEALAKDGDGLKDSRSWGWTGGVVARVLPKSILTTRQGNHPPMRSTLVLSNMISLKLALLSRRLRMKPTLLHLEGILRREFSITSLISTLADVIVMVLGLVMVIFLSLWT